MHSVMVYQISCTVLTLPIVVLCVAACETRYTKEPLYEYRCVSGSEMVISQTDRPKCQWQCSRQYCSYINYHHDSKQCGIRLGQCETLAPAAGVMVNVYWKSRDVCIHWGSYQEPGRVAVGGGSYKPPGRAKIGEAMIVGKYTAHPSTPRIWANYQGEQLDIVHGSGTVVEVLTTMAGCPLFWVLYTGGDPLPNGAVVGGYLTDGTATYLARKQYSTNLACGYYNTESEMIHYESSGARTSSTMEMLVLL